MMTYLRYGLALFFILSQMTSCSDSDSVSSNQSKDDPATALPGMMRISAENAVVQLGTNEVSAMVFYHRYNVVIYQMLDEQGSLNIGKYRDNNQYHYGYQLNRVGGKKDFE